VHHVLVREVRVGEHHLGDVVLGDQPLELGLGADRDAARVARAGQRGREDAVVDAGDLRCGERHHAAGRIVPVDGREHVEVPTAGTHDHDVAHRVLLVEGARPPTRAAPTSGWAVPWRPLRRLGGATLRHVEEDAPQRQEQQDGGHQRTHGAGRRGRCGGEDGHDGRDGQHPRCRDVEPAHDAARATLQAGTQAGHGLLLVSQVLLEIRDGASFGRA
jgi:hypothetical protein